MKDATVRFTSKQEIIDLIKAGIAISLAFTIAQTGLEFTSAFLTKFLIIFGVSAVVVGPGFLLHELMHKVFAQRYGCWAEFRANDFMLMICLISSTFGFIFAAPGAVYIVGNLGLRRNAIVSLAGPLLNVVLAFLFLLVPIPLVASMGFGINAWLALFNMIPFMGLDGQKVFNFSPPLWIAVTGALVYMNFFLF